MTTENQQTQTAPNPSEQTPPSNPMLNSANLPPPPKEALAPKPEANPAPAVTISEPKPAPTGASPLASMAADSPTMRVAVAYIDNIASETKLDTARALGHSLEQNNAQFIDEAYIRETIKDPAKAQSTIDMLKSVVEHKAETYKTSIANIYAKAGGEANWQSAVAAFNKTASASTKAAVTEAINSGKQSLMDFAVEQILSVGKANGVIVQHNEVPLGHNSSEQGISRAEYAKRISARGITQDSPEYKEATRLFLLGKRQGL